MYLLLNFYRRHFCEVISPKTKTASKSVENGFDFYTHDGFFPASACLPAEGLRAKFLEKTSGFESGLPRVPVSTAGKLSQPGAIGTSVGNLRLSKKVTQKK